MNDGYIKDFDKWNSSLKDLDSTNFNGFCYEREIWWCAIGVNVGSEQDGTTELFERPVLIIRKIRKDLLLIAPFTTKIKDSPHRIKTDSTGIDSQILLDQIRIVSSKRLVRKTGYVKIGVFQEVLIDLMRLILDSPPIETPP